MQKKGFTLIELLVVIAIIAVLAAILFPVFARARAKARQTGCLSQMQQIGQASVMYSSDYGGFIVPWCVTNPNPNNPGMPQANLNSPQPGLVTWDISLDSYRVSKLLHCMDNPYGREARAYVVARYTQRPFTMGGATVFLGGHMDGPSVPEETVLFFEKGANPPGSWGDALGENIYQSHSNDYATVPDNGKMFHANGKNICYLDGHAKWAPAGQGPFANDPNGSGSNLGRCEDWGKVGDGGDWPSS